jgi:hypothetical protein
MKPVAFDPQADEELVLAAAWYEQHREGLAEAFLHQVKRTMNRIIQNPRWFPKIETPSRSVVRRAPVSRIQSSTANLRTKYLSWLSLTQKGNRVTGLIESSRPSLLLW